MKRPIIWAGIFTGLGILLGQFADARTVIFFMTASLLLCVSLFLKYRYWPVFVFLLFAFAGVVRVQSSAADPLNGQPVEVSRLEGVVIEKGLTASGNQKLTVRLTNPIEVTSTDVLTGKESVSEVKQLMVYAGADVPLGAFVSLTGRIEPLEKPEHPWGYDEFTYLRSRKIDAKMFAIFGGVEVLPDGRPSAYLRLLARLHQTRDGLVAVYAKALPAREAGIMQSILLGDKSGLEESTAELYRVSGIYHILCISGLHIGIFMLITGWLLKFILPERFAWVLGLCILILYTLLTGASVSTVRATAMGGVFVFSKILFRDYDLRASASFTCIALLLYEPFYLFDAGFGLSFGAVFGIAFLTAPVERLLSRVFKNFPLKSTLASGIAATLAAYPFLMFHFYEISAYGIIVNLFVIPTAALLVGAGLAALLSGFVFLPAGVFFAGISYYLLKFYDTVSGFFASLPFAVIQTGHVGLPACLAFFAAIAGLAYALSDFTKARQKKMTVFWCGALAFSVLYFLQMYPLSVAAVNIPGGTLIRYRNASYIAESAGAGTENDTEREACLSYYNAEGAVKIPKGESMENAVIRIDNGVTVAVEVKEK